MMLLLLFIHLLIDIHAVLRHTVIKILSQPYG